MKKLLIIFTLTFLVCTNLAAQTAETKTAIQEADKLSREVVKLFGEKKFSEAEPLARQVILIREKESGKDHISVAEGLRNLALIQIQLKKIKFAEESFDKAFEIYEKNQPLSPANAKTFVQTLEASATYNANDGNLDKAQLKFLRAIDLRENMNGKDSLELANSLLQLGQIYRVEGKFEKAAPVFFRALEIRKAKLKIYADEVEEAYLETSCVYRKLKREQELSEIRNQIYPIIPDSDADKSKVKDKTLNVGVANGKAIHLPKPDYPDEARRNRISGTVNVLVYINEAGNVNHACALDGPKELQLVSEASAYGAKFRPTTLNGKPFKVTGTVVYRFVP